MGARRSCIDRLLDHFGGGDVRGSQRDCAMALGTYSKLVHQWHRMGWIPLRWGLEVERVTGGEVTMQEMVGEHNERFPLPKVPHVYSR
jgi:DNA-binding transcriptional regulator YdaS (Cro superfamily)